MEGTSIQRACVAHSASGLRHAACPRNPVVTTVRCIFALQATGAVAKQYIVNATPSSPVTDNREKAIVEWDYYIHFRADQVDAVAHPTASEVYGAMRSDERASGFVVPVSSEYDALRRAPGPGWCSLVGMCCIVAHCAAVPFRPCGS